MNLGLVGVWIAFASDEWLRGLLMLLRWRSRAWEKHSVVTKEDKEVMACEKKLAHSLN
jgi:Na+-driven multidrug efflux pump